MLLLDVWFAVIFCSLFLRHERYHHSFRLRNLVAIPSSYELHLTPSYSLSLAHTHSGQLYVFFCFTFICSFPSTFFFISVHENEHLLLLVMCLAFWFCISGLLVCRVFSSTNSFVSQRYPNYSLSPRVSLSICLSRLLTHLPLQMEWNSNKKKINMLSSLSLKNDSSANVYRTAQQIDRTHNKTDGTQSALNTVLIANESGSWKHDKLNIAHKPGN